MRKLEPFENYLIHEFVEDYNDGLMSRRDMIRRVLLITGGIATTATILTSLGVTPMLRAAYAQETTPVSAEPRSSVSVPAGDERVTTAELSFDGNGTTLLAYSARPSSSGGATLETGTMATPEAGVMASPSVGGAFPVVLICHENRGLTDHIRDVTRRWAVEGYLAVAVDLLSRDGGTAAVSDPAEIPALLTRDVDPARHVGDFQATVEYLRADPAANLDRLGMTGFCFGGGITWQAVTVMPEIRAAAPFYGPPPPLETVPNINAAMLGVYSDDPSDFANEGRDALVAELETAGVVHQINVYPNSQHAFHNDTGPRFNPVAALAAWNDTVAWFAQYV